MPSKAFWDLLFADDTEGSLTDRSTVRSELAQARKLGADAREAGIEVDLDDGAVPMDIYQLFAAVTHREYRAGSSVDERYILQVAHAYEVGAGVAEEDPLGLGL